VAARRLTRWWRRQPQHVDDQFDLRVWVVEHHLAARVAERVGLGDQGAERGGVGVADALHVEEHPHASRLARRFQRAEEVAEGRLVENPIEMEDHGALHAREGLFPYLQAVHMLASPAAHPGIGDMHGARGSP